MEVLQNPPSRSEFTSLSEHQSQTPTSFYDGPAILYHHSSACTLKISKHDLEAVPAVASLASDAKTTGHGQVNGHSEAIIPNGENSTAEGGEEEYVEVEIPNVDIWVTSARLLLFSPSQHSGVSIPYPSISLHAIQRPSSTHSTTTINTPAALFLQILPEASATFDDHDPDETISLYIIPTSLSIPPSSTTSTDTTTTATETVPIASTSASATAETTPHTNPTETDEVTLIFTALSTCANLHPDQPMYGDDDDDNEYDNNDAGYDNLNADVNGADNGLPPPMPGSGGWITAENVGEFLDEEGNWRGWGRGGVLGGGAGTVRGRDEGEDGEEEGDGEGEETKWSRTG